MYQVTGKGRQWLQSWDKQSQSDHKQVVEKQLICGASYALCSLIIVYIHSKYFNGDSYSLGGLRKNGLIAIGGGSSEKGSFGVGFIIHEVN